MGQGVQVGLDNLVLRGVEHLALFAVLVSLGVTLVFSLISYAYQKRHGADR